MSQMTCFGYRLRLFALAGEIGVRAACRTMDVRHSTHYRWKRCVELVGSTASTSAALSWMKHAG